MGVRAQTLMVESLKEPASRAESSEMLTAFSLEERRVSFLFLGRLGIYCFDSTARILAAPIRL